MVCRNTLGYVSGFTFGPRDSDGNILAFRGGGNVVNAGMDRSRPPLRWMVFEAGALGLRTAPFKHDLSPDQQIHIKESLTPLWWPLEILFFNRLTYTRREQGKKTTHKLVSSNWVAM
jgi:hypothetical protein